MGKSRDLIVLVKFCYLLWPAATYLYLHGTSAAGCHLLLH